MTGQQGGDARVPGDDGGRSAPPPLRIVIGICGGIAAYKAVLVVRQLSELGHHVDVVPTEAALRFIGRPTLEAISGNPVTADVFDDVAEVRHVALGQQADVIAVVPATANTIASMAAGLADDLLGTTLLASRAPIVIAPAMHSEMWQHPATRDNISRLIARGVIITGPGEGRLTGGDSGPGRLAEPEPIVRAILDAAEERDAAGARDLRGTRVLITAGGTREPLDPVRFLGNRSSGRQGIELARRASSRGAEVTLVAANLEHEPPAGVRLVEAPTAEQMARACASLAPGHNVVIMAAAVADYRPLRVADGKIRKEQAGDTLTIELTRNPDILASLAAAKRPDQLIIGFAAETEPDDEARLRLGQAKITRKGCDLLVINRVGWDAGFGSPENAVEIITLTGEVVRRHAGSKASVADAILDVTRELR